MQDAELKDLSLSFVSGSPGQSRLICRKEKLNPPFHFGHFIQLHHVLSVQHSRLDESTSRRL